MCVYRVSHQDPGRKGEREIDNEKETHSHSPFRSTFVVESLDGGRVRGSCVRAFVRIAKSEIILRE